MAVASLRWLAAAAAASRWLPAVSAQLEREQPKPWAGAVQTPAPKFEAEIELAPVLTARPAIRNVLQKRQTNTCGYVDGDPASAYICAADDAVCLFNDRASAVGCCLASGCNIYTACLDYVSSDATSTLNMDRTRYCSNSRYPSCAALVYADTSWSGYTVPTCDSVRTTYNFYLSTLERDTDTAIPTSSRSNRTSFLLTEIQSSMAATGRTDDDFRGGSNSAATESPDPNQGPVAQGSSPPVGPIVGGVVGGVALLALIALGVFFLLRKKNQSQPSPPPAPLANPTYPNQMPSPPPDMATPHSAFAPVDPRYSMVRPPMATTVAPTQEPPMQGHPMQPPISPLSSPGTSPSPVYHAAMPPMGPPPPPAQHPMSMHQPMPAPAPHGPVYTAYQPPPDAAVELPTQRGDGQLHELS